MGTSKCPRLLLTVCALVALGAAAWAADRPTPPASRSHRKAHKKVAPLVLPPLPAGPLRQVPMDQIPASAPQVSYQNGMLAISSQNSTLGEILKNVRQLTGASIDLPPNGANERVVAQLGPGAPRDVLAQLLNGTAFNYVMVGTAADPKTIASVVISPKPMGGEVQTAANYQPPVDSNPIQPPMPFRPGIVQQQPPATAEADDSSDDSDAEDKDDEEGDQSAQPQPGGVAVQPGEQPDQSGVPNGGPMTPEQILQKLRQGQPQPPQGYPQPPQQQQQ
jgi:hypothetical protein